MKRKQPRFIGIDLFAGAGGMTCGAKLAGVEVVACVENNTHAAATYKHNHKEVTVHEEDIRTWRSYPSARPDQIKILFGGPPCQGFSTSNQRTRNKKNIKNFLFEEFLRVAEEWEPHWIVFENVKGIAETEKGMFLETILSRIREIGYQVNHGFLQAADYGVPQRRTRLFIIGSANHPKARLPKPKLKIPISTWDAISDLPVLQNGAAKDRLPYRSEPTTDYQKLMRQDLKDCGNHLVTKNFQFVIERYRHIPQGGNWEDIPDEMMDTYTDKTKCHTGIYHRLLQDKPSIVIGNFRKNMLIHPTQDRGLSVREAARLQSFPDSYEFKGSIGFQQQQVGNAVPPLLAKAVFQALIETHTAHLRKSKKPKAKKHPTRHST